MVGGSLAVAGLILGWIILGIFLGFAAGIIIFVIALLLTWITRLIWRPYRSTIEKLVYGIKEAQKEEVKEV
jgi:hypothetical protein